MKVAKSSVTVLVSTPPGVTFCSRAGGESQIALLGDCALGGRIGEQVEGDPGGREDGDLVARCQVGIILSDHVRAVVDVGADRVAGCCRAGAA